MKEVGSRGKPRRGAVVICLVQARTPLNMQPELLCKTKGSTVAFEDACPEAQDGRKGRRDPQKHQHTKHTGQLSHAPKGDAAILGTATSFFQEPGSPLATLKSMPSYSSGDR